MPLTLRVFLASMLMVLAACAGNEIAVKNEQLTEEQIVRTDLSQVSDKVCKYTRVTGSQIPRLQCFTPDEIVRMEADAKARLRKASRGGSPRDN
ncbi:hypothetical protein MnTg04_00610 [bacterium MnTg04]|nr:hypothetical protein MnTg04_00610 [bacterium MnTg04]